MVPVSLSTLPPDHLLLLLLELLLLVLRLRAVPRMRVAKLAGPC